MNFGVYQISFWSISIYVGNTFWKNDLLELFIRITY